jgi:hypothetical protein
MTYKANKAKGAVCSEICTKTQREHNVEFLNVKRDDT